MTYLTLEQIFGKPKDNLEGIRESIESNRKYLEDIKEKARWMPGTERCSTEGAMMLENLKTIEKNIDKMQKAYEMLVEYVEKNHIYVL